MRTDSRLLGCQDGRILYPLETLYLGQRDPQYCNRSDSDGASSADCMVIAAGDGKKNSFIRCFSLGFVVSHGSRSTTIDILIY